MTRVLALAFALLFTGNTEAGNNSIFLSTGVWEIVKLEPDSHDSPLNNENWYFVFLENDVLLEVRIPNNGKGKFYTALQKYNLLNNQLVITDQNKKPSSHTIYIEGELIRLSVPFGALWLKAAPNKPIHPTPKSGAADG